MQVSVECSGGVQALRVAAGSIQTLHHDWEAERIAFNLGGTADLPTCLLIAFAWEAIAHDALWIRRLRRTTEPKSARGPAGSSLNHLQIAANRRALSIYKWEARITSLMAEVAAADEGRQRLKMQKKLDHASKRLQRMKDGREVAASWATLNQLRTLRPEAIRLLTRGG